MRRSKNGPALFELIGDRALSGRAAARPAGGDHPPEMAARTPADSRLPDPAAPGEDPAVAAWDEARRPEAGAFDHTVADTVVQFEGDRVRISLSSLGAAMATFAVIVILAGGFLLGKSRGRQDGVLAGYEAGRASFEAVVVNDIEAARKQSPATYLIGGLLENQEPSKPSGKPSRGSERGLAPNLGVEEGTTAAPARPGNAQPAWIDGFTYIVAQEFPGTARADAEAAQSYLEQHGVSAAIVTQPGGRLQLTTVQGYNRKDPAQRKLSDQLGEKVRAIGAQYYASGGRYKLEGYLKTHKNES